MKKLLSIAMASALAFPAAGFAQALKVGTVDMQKAFKEYGKTKDAEAKINDAKNTAKKEYDDRAEGYKKALDEINNLNRNWNLRPSAPMPRPRRPRSGTTRSPTSKTWS